MYENLHDRAFAKVMAKMQMSKIDLDRWENETPYMALTQEMINNQISFHKREIETYNYILTQLEKSI